ncbi:MAG: hypothetical protein ABI632_01030 [Pseudolysinimonas sp.]
MRVRNRLAVLASTGIIAITGIVGLGAAAGAAAADTSACNSYAAVLAGQGMECSVIVDNYIDGAVEYSTVTVKECHGAAFTVLLAPACTTTVIVNTELTISVSQCNGTLNGGGSNVTCTVQVNNHFSGTATAALATINQCIGSGAGGVSPVGAPLNCSPPGLTSGATVTQCNGSVNGGGAPLRVNCNVQTGAETAVPILIDQCNGTVNGGGSVLFCSAAFFNEFNVVGLPTPPTTGSTTTTPSPTGGTFGTPGGPVFQPPAVGGVTVTASGPVLAMSGGGRGSFGAALAAIAAIMLGAAGVLAGARRIHRPAHRMP